jgi:phage baseplate assembly protein W
MAIKISNLGQIAETYRDTGYLYKDISLDLQQSLLLAPGFNLPTPGSDLKASFNLAAIQNSLNNLFNTLPGQRFLFPEYGLNLNQFLFSPITELNGQILGDTILKGIKTYEPRVMPLQVRVEIDPDNNQYNVAVILEVPDLNLITNLDFILDIKKQTFITLPTQK